jgi:hypothetical protein
MNAPRTLIAGGAALLALALATPAVLEAQQDGNTGRRGGRGNFDPAEFFSRMDANGDGSLDASEFRGGEDRFKEADKNGDGKVSQEEMQAAFQARMESFRRGDRGTGDGAPGFGPGNFVDRLKEPLGVSDEEWAILKPRLEKIATLQMEMRPGGGRGPGASAAMPEAEALKATLDRPEATAEEIAAKIADLRKAREKKQADLKTAREELRELVTPHQEGVLILEGVLD